MLHHISLHHISLIHISLIHISLILLLINTIHTLQASNTKTYQIEAAYKSPPLLTFINRKKLVFYVQEDADDDIIHNSNIKFISSTNNLISIMFLKTKSYICAKKDVGDTKLYLIDDNMDEQYECLWMVDEASNPHRLKIRGMCLTVMDRKPNKKYHKVRLGMCTDDENQTLNIIESEDVDDNDEKESEKTDNDKNENRNNKDKDKKNNTNDKNNNEHKDNNKSENKNNDNKNDNANKNNDNKNDSKNNDHKASTITSTIISTITTTVISTITTTASVTTINTKTDISTSIETKTTTVSSINTITTTQLSTITSTLQTTVTNEITSTVTDSIKRNNQREHNNHIDNLPFEISPAVVVVGGNNGIDNNAPDDADSNDDSITRKDKKARGAKARKKDRSMPYIKKIGR